MKEKIEVSRDRQSNQYSVVLTQGGDTIRCMVSVTPIEQASPNATDAMYREALSRAKGLAKALDAAIEDR